jgi:hypothetical protein
MSSHPTLIRQRVFRNWFIQQWEKTPILMLGVGLCTIAITATGLGFTIAGYLLQRHANQAELASAGPWAELRADPKFVVLGFTNIGKKPARRVLATLFGVDKNKDWTRKQKLGEGAIVGAGTNIVPGYNGQAKITFRGQTPDLFLACVTYYDDSNNPMQPAFLLNVEAVKASGGGVLDELETPNAEACT